MEELVISTHDFEESKNQLKRFSEETTTDFDLKKVDSSKDVGEFLKDAFWGRGWGTEHKVTGAELNSLTTQVQNYLIDINNMQRNFIREFGQVYTALEALDRDYIQSILIAVKSAQKANREAKIAQNDIGKTVEEQKKIIKVLQQFKEKLDKYKHIVDVDRMWEEFQIFQKEIYSNQKIINTLEEFKNRIDKCRHLFDMDELWLNSQLQQENIVQMMKSNKQFALSIKKQENAIDNLLEEKRALDEITHLLDVDLIWNDVIEGNKKVALLSKKIDRLTEKTAAQAEELLPFKEMETKLNAQKHIYEIDVIWENLNEIGKKNEDISLCLVQYSVLIKEQKELMEEFVKKISRLDSVTHLLDVDLLFEEHITLGNKVAILMADKLKLEETVTALSEKLSEEHNKAEERELRFLNKIKIVYLLAGTSIGFAVIEFFLIVLRLV